jgi:hypothetical protein
MVPYAFCGLSGRGFGAYSSMKYGPIAWSGIPPKMLCGVFLFLHSGWGGGAFIFFCFFYYRDPVGVQNKIKWMTTRNGRGGIPPPIHHFLLPSAPCAHGVGVSSLHRCAYRCARGALVFAFWQPHSCNRIRHVPAV